MKKVLVIGSGGAGKSTFSRRLGDVLGIDVIHLDQLYWQPNWVEPAKAEWAGTVEKLLTGDSWIMDGNYGGTRTIRMNACDTAILLDLPRTICVFRVLKRIWKYRGQTAPKWRLAVRRNSIWSFSSGFGISKKRKSRKFWPDLNGFRVKRSLF